MKEPFLKAKYFMGSMTNIANRPFRRLVTELGDGSGVLHDDGQDSNSGFHYKTPLFTG